MLIEEGFYFIINKVKCIIDHIESSDNATLRSTLEMLCNFVDAENNDLQVSTASEILEEEC